MMRDDRTGTSGAGRREFMQLATAGAAALWLPASAQADPPEPVTA